MNISDALKQMPFVLKRTDFSKRFNSKHEGKVRDSYRHNNSRVIVATDRISVFDFPVGYVPYKGQLLNQLSAFWFEHTRDIIPNHLITIPDPNITVAKQCRTLPVEMVVRGYITGVTTTSMWYHYSQGARTFCGHHLPEGMRKNDRLPEPLVTPSTKETRKGVHDQSVSSVELLKRLNLPSELYERMVTSSLSLYLRGSQMAARAGYILVDTKYEFGLDEQDNLLLIDEVHTPDSSRYWRMDLYELCRANNKEMDYFDKEYVRLWLAERGLDQFGQEAARANIPAELFAETTLRFVAVYEALAGRSFQYSVGDPLPRIEQSICDYLAL